MEKLGLKAEPREAGKGAAHEARRAGNVPAVLYGHGIKGGTPIQVNAKELDRLLLTGGRHLAELTLGNQSQSVMIKDVQRDVVKGQVLHVDFYGVSLKEKMHATVPVAVHGMEAVAKAGGIVEHHLHSIEVECLPGDLPDAIEADITLFHAGQHLSVADLKVPKGVKLLANPEDVVVTIDRPQAEAEPAGAAKPEPDPVKPKKAE